MGESSTGTRGRKIVLVDDDPHVLRTTRAYLESKGYQVSTSESPFIAPLLQSERPDLIVMDMDMPVINGEKLYSILHAQDSLAEIPVIFFSGLSREKQLEAVNRTGAAGFVHKEEGLVALNMKIATVFDRLASS